MFLLKIYCNTQYLKREEARAQCCTVNLEPDASKSDNFLSCSRQFDYVTAALYARCPCFTLINRVFQRKQCNQDLFYLSAK